MKTRLFVAMFAVAALAVATNCGKKSSDSPTGPGAQTTTTTSVFNTELTPANEVPAVANAEASVSGTATITLKTTKNASGTMTAATADFQVNVSGFPAGSSVTMAHIHPGAAGANGGILVSTGMASGDVVLSSGAGSFVRAGVPISAEIAQGILNNPGAYYFNIHSLMNAAGVARGQLGTPTSSTVTDPGTGYPY